MIKKSWKNRVFDTIDKVRGHVEEEHSINVQEIVDKLIKLPSNDNLRSYRCVACPASARYTFILTFYIFHT